MVRGRMEVCGPTQRRSCQIYLYCRDATAKQICWHSKRKDLCYAASSSPHATDQEWCDRRCWREFINSRSTDCAQNNEPLSPQDFYRFLFAWQRADAEHRVEGPEGLQSILEQLDGCELPLAAWESAVLAARVDDYDPEWLDRLCFSGRIGWGRLSAPQNRTHTSAPLEQVHRTLSTRKPPALAATDPGKFSMELSVAARTLFDTLAAGGALFFSELVRRGGLLPSHVEEALSQLAALGLVTSDSFDGLRALLVPSSKRPTFCRDAGKRRRKTNLASIEFAGRLSLLRTDVAAPSWEWSGKRRARRCR